MPRNKGRQKPVNASGGAPNKPVTTTAALPADLVSKLAEAESNKTWFQKNSTWIGWVYASISSIFVVILGGVIFWAAAKLEKIETHAAEIAHLKQLPVSVENLRSSTTSDFKTVTNQLTELKVKVATLETIPVHLKAIDDEIKSVRIASSQAASDASAAKQGIAAAAKEVESVQQSLAKSASLLDQLKPISDGVKETRGLVSKIEAPPLQTTAVIRIPLQDAKPINDSGHFRRWKVTIKVENIPLLADENKLRTATIASAELRSRSVSEFINNFALEPNLYRGDGTLSLIVWCPKDEGPPKLDGDTYALLTVSWPDAQ